MKLTQLTRFLPMILPVATLLTINAPVHEAWAHSRWLPSGSLPSLRNTNSGNKSADGVCGKGARNANPVVLQAGQSLDVQWEETINHPGYFRIAFSPGADQGYDTNVLMDKIIDTQNDNLTPHSYSATIKIPSTPCTDCTLQLVQYMTESNPPTLYHSCADIIIKANAPVYTPPSPAPHVVPTVPSTETCD